MQRSIESLDSAMAVQQHYFSDEFQRLTTEAARLRLLAIRSQIAIGLTFCSVGERQLNAGYNDQVDAVLAKLRKLVATVRRHLDEPEHVPSFGIEKVRTELSHLESGILALEKHKGREP